jgi:hypothetical protein
MDSARYTLRDRDTGALIGSMTADQLQFLEEVLEADGASDDHEYVITADTIDMLEEEGAGTYLLRMLRDALEDRDGMAVEWTAR